MVARAVADCAANGVAAERQAKPLRMLMHVVLLLRRVRRVVRHLHRGEGLRQLRREVAVQIEIARRAHKLHVGDRADELLARRLRAHLHRQRAGVGVRACLCASA